MPGRAVLLHALAHIEFNAINLALDAVWRFPSMPDAFYRDWFKVAAEEARHFSLLSRASGGIRPSIRRFSRARRPVGNGRAHARRRARAHGARAAHAGSARAGRIAADPPASGAGGRPRIGGDSRRDPPRRNRPRADRQSLVPVLVRARPAPIRMPLTRNSPSSITRRNCAVRSISKRAATPVSTKPNCARSPAWTTSIPCKLHSFPDDCPQNSRLRIRHHARHAAARAPLGRAGRAHALHAAWLDGYIGVVPVRRRCARRRLAGDRARCARFRPVGLAGRAGQRAATTGSRTTSPISTRCSTTTRQLIARGTGEPGRPQHGRERRLPVCGRAAGAGAPGGRSGRVRHGGGASRERSPARLAQWLDDIARAANAEHVRHARRRRPAADPHQSAPCRWRKRGSWPQHWSKPDGDRPFPSARRSRAQSCAGRCCTGWTR